VYRAALLSILVTIPSVPVRAQTAQDSAAIRALSIRYETAIRTRNAGVLRGDYAAKAVWLDGTGTSRTGPDSIIAIIGRQFDDSAYSASLLSRVRGQQVTYIRPDVAVYERREHQRLNDPGGVGVRDVVTTMLLSRESGQWLIQRQTDAASRPAPTPPPTMGVAMGVTGGFFNSTQVDVPVKQLACTAPKYPPELRAAKVNGSVTLRYIVGVDGRIETGSVQVTSSTNRTFEQPAIDAVLTCTSTAAMIKGNPVRQIVEQVVRFAIS
jgi:uncharacterized protein (TIGR02246 family)